MRNQSGNNEYIRQLESQNAELRKQNDQLREQVEQLESEVYKQKFKGHGGAAGVDAMIELADQERRQFKRNFEIFASWYPTEFTAIPTKEKEQFLESGTVTKSDGTLRATSKNALPVSFRVAIYQFDGTTGRLSPTSIFIYPGTREELQAELEPRLTYLLTRSPTIDELGGELVRGVSIWRHLDALACLAPYRNDPDLIHAYDVVFDNAFKDFIESAAAVPRDEARRQFRTVVEQSYKNMTGHQRGKGIKPKLSTGRKSKLDSEKTIWAKPDFK